MLESIWSGSTCHIMSHHGQLKSPFQEVGKPRTSKHPPNDLDMKFCRSFAISCHVIMYIYIIRKSYIFSVIIYYYHALSSLWFPWTWRSWSANRYCCVGKSQWLAAIRWWLANANENLALLAIGWSERVVFPKNMAFIWGYPGSWLGMMASLRTPLKSKTIYCHGFYSHANNLQNVWLQSTGHGSSQGDSFSRWCDEYIGNKKNTETIGLLFVRHVDTCRRCNTKRPLPWAASLRRTTSRASTTSTTLKAIVIQRSSP